MAYSFAARLRRYRSCIQATSTPTRMPTMAEAIEDQGSSIGALAFRPRSIRPRRSKVFPVDVRSDFIALNEAAGLAVQINTKALAQLRSDRYGLAQIPFSSSTPGAEPLPSFLRQAVEIFCDDFHMSQIITHG